ELNRRANQVAHYLRRAHGVGPDTMVALCLERSPEMVVGLLGILKAGGAYLPLDPRYPVEQLSYMIGDAKPAVLLTQAALTTQLARLSIETLALDTEWSAIETFPMANLAPDSIGLEPRHLAYVIYTSGSTGSPKGAMNEHGALLNRLQWMQEAYRLGEGDRVLQKTPYTFDVSVWEFLWTLSFGGELVVARPE